MKIICGDLDEQHSGKTGSKYSSLLFGVLKIQEFTFLGLQKQRFLLFWGTEFWLGLSPLFLPIKRAPLWATYVLVSNWARPMFCKHNQ